jgi:hypothetical protein
MTARLLSQLHLLRFLCVQSNQAPGQNSEKSLWQQMAFALGICADAMHDERLKAKLTGRA